MGVLRIRFEDTSLGQIISKYARNSPLAEAADKGALRTEYPETAYLTPAIFLFSADTGSDPSRIPSYRSPNVAAPAGSHGALIDYWGRRAG